MDDTFSYRTTVPIRRQLDPRAVKAAIFFAVVVLGIGLFARWVIASERESFADLHRPGGAGQVAVTQIASSVDPASTDGDAKDAARIALAAAKAAFTEHRSFLDAGPAQLTALQPGYSFVDGVSTMSRIVSVATTEHTWAAAIESSSGTCFWIRATETGSVARGTLGECTGTAALTAPDRGW